MIQPHQHTKADFVLKFFAVITLALLPFACMEGLERQLALTIKNAYHGRQTATTSAVIMASSNKPHQSRSLSCPHPKPSKNTAKPKETNK